MQNEKVPAAMQDNVTQADREAAATAYCKQRGAIEAEHSQILSGLRDDHVLVGLFARHRLASTTAQSEAVRKLVEALEALVGETLGGDLSRDDENQVTPRGSYQAWISWSDRWAARDALAAHRESQP